MKLARLIFISIWLWSSAAFGATYYIDFSGGNDSAAGTSEGTAWKTLPGTRNVGNTGWQSTDWGSGTFNSSNKVPAGTVFRMKPGTTHSSSNGGMIQLDTTYYDGATVENTTKFVAYQAWSGASGSVTFDGSGMTIPGGGSGGLFYATTLGGFEWDGEAGTDGIVFQDSDYAAIQMMYSSEREGVIIHHVKGYNNGVALSGDQASYGQFRFRYHKNCSFSDMVIDGNNNSINGILLADGGMRCTGATITDVTAYNHYGTNDGGFGIKAYNSEVTLTRVTAYSNFKGIDLGEDDSNAAWDIVYKIIDSTFYNNTESGIGLSGSGTSAENSNNWYVINCIIYDNGNYGINAYAGLFNLYVVHSVFDGNNWNICANPDNDNEVDRTYLYNNIFYKPTDANFLVKYWTDASSDYVVDSDYNSWIQNSSEYFCRWSYYQEGPNFSYGSDGPGHGEGSNWFDWKGGDTSANSLGHQGCDSHSVGTGVGEEVQPPFTDVNGNDYTLTTHYLGTDISGKPWYISEMGTDRNGVSRTSWDMGAYEYVSGTPSATGGQGFTLTGGTLQ